MHTYIHTYIHKTNKQALTHTRRVLISSPKSKFLVPHADVWFSKYLVENSRDGVKVIQFRVANARGNLLTNVTVDAKFFQSVTSIEGERFGKMRHIEFSGSSYMWLPGERTVIHSVHIHYLHLSFTLKLFLLSSSHFIFPNFLCIHFFFVHSLCSVAFISPASSLYICYKKKCYF